MFDKCPLINIKCPFCVIEKKEYHCGIGIRSKRFVGIESRIKFFDKCPNGKEKVYANNQDKEV